MVAKVLHAFYCFYLSKGQSEKIAYFGSVTYFCLCAGFLTIPFLDFVMPLNIDIENRFLGMLQTGLLFLPLFVCIYLIYPYEVIKRMPESYLSNNNEIIYYTMFLFSLLVFLLESFLRSSYSTC